PPSRGATRQPGAGIQERGPPPLPKEFNPGKERTLRRYGSQGRTGYYTLSRIGANDHQPASAGLSKLSPSRLSPRRELLARMLSQKQSDDLHSFSRTERLYSEPMNSFGEERSE